MTTDDPIKPIEQYREYLLILARVHRDALTRSGLDPSDLVQMTLLKAHRRREQFRGGSGGEQAKWMRMILTNTLIDEIRGKAPNVRVREKTLEELVHESSRRVESLLQDGRGVPGIPSDRHEVLIGVAEALERLPDDQRRAVELRYLQGLPIAEIARHMERSEGSVGGLLQRGLRRLRELLDEN